MNDNTINNDRTMSGAAGVLLANRYRVVKQLGQGGMGSVWLAEDAKLDGRKVAIKMLPSILVSNKRAYAQVKAEALVSLKLTHTNIAAVRAFEEENGNPFLVMDYIEGQTLDDYFAEKGTLAEEEAIRVLKPIAAALDYAHEQGVVHRDVKPGNVMIDQIRHPYVLDFGIAREVQETMTRVTGKLSSGTLMYMSPEQLHGAAPKPAQDVYSFAAMAYECLTGHPPFSRGQIEYQIEHDTPEPLPRHIAICRGVMAGLAKTPEDRPATCVAVLSAGSRVPRDRPSAGAPHKTRIAAVLLALAAFVGVGGWWWREKAKSEVPSVPPVAAVSDQSETPSSKPVEDPTSVRAQETVKIAEALTLKKEAESHLGSKVGDTKTITLPGGATMEMVWCPPGSFQMGSPLSEENRDSDEMQHNVTLTQGFWMGKYEVTQRQWESVMGENPSYFKSPTRPVELVSWEDCQRFIQKINAEGRVTVSLPTEAQWEYACRAGSTTSLPNGKTLRVLGANNGPALDEIAWYGGNSSVGFELPDGYDVSDLKEKQYPGSKAGTHPVGQKKPNDWGLYDMIGNVWEWCADWYGRDYYAEAPSNDPAGPASGATRVDRGGSWYFSAQFCRSANRSWSGPGNRGDDLGLRLVCSAGPRR